MASTCFVMTSLFYADPLLLASSSDGLSVSLRRRTGTWAECGAGHRFLWPANAVPSTCARSLEFWRSASPDSRRVCHFGSRRASVALRNPRMASFHGLSV
jgi:hypothetical protein